MVKTLAVDAMNLAYKSFFKMPKYLSNDSGYSTGVIYGFLNSLNSKFKQFNPENIVLIWDSPRNFRKEWYSSYKQRPKDDDFKRFSEQVIVLKDYIPDIGIPCLELEGYEADDLIAMLAVKEDIKPLLILTSDTDCYQALYPDVTIFNGKDFITIQNLTKEYGFKHPVEYTIFKSMTGCTTDTVSGIKGISKIKALKLFKECNYNIEKLYNRIDELGYTQEFNESLILIVNPLGYEFKDLGVKQCKIDRRKLAELFMKFNINSINVTEFLKRS